MTAQIVVEMMSENPILWRCLHGGPLTANSIERWDPKASLPWAEFRARNLPLLKNLTHTYGACAVVARIGDRFIGHLRFYPKAVCELAEPALGMCMQQQFPSGPADDFAGRRLPPLAEIGDKTLRVHCMMIASVGLEGESYQRKGLGTRMARKLINWATENGWQAIEATAYEALDIIYTSSGQAGQRFWEKLGFRLVRTDIEPALDEDNDFVRHMREEATAKGLDPAKIKNKYIMRLDLS